MTGRITCLGHTGMMLVALVGSTAFAGEARVVEDVIHSPALEENLLGDTAERSVLVYLPPGYDESPNRRYPVLYLFHGGGVTGRFWIDDSILDGHNIEPAMERLLAAGRTLEMIIVMPDVFSYTSSNYPWSLYTNTPVMGNYDDYLSRDLVQHIDSNYRTVVDPAARGISGQSLGGYGAVYLAMKHPDVFAVVYGQDASALDFDLFPEFNTESDNRSVFEIIQSADVANLESAGIFIKILFAVAASFSPNPDSPFFVDWPWVESDGELVHDEAVWAKWKSFEPVALIPSLRTNLLALRAIMFDAGDGRGDERSTNIRDARSFSQALSDAGIPHVFEEFVGTHTSHTGVRLEEKVLPFFSQNFAQALAGIQVVSVTPSAGVGITGETMGIRAAVRTTGPSTTTAEYPDMAVSLSPLGLPRTIPLIADGEGMYEGSLAITVPSSNGRYVLPVRVQLADGTWVEVQTTEVAVYPGDDMVIFDDVISSLWHSDASGGAENLRPASEGPVHQGEVASAVPVEPARRGRPWTVSFQPAEAVNHLGYTALRFAIHPGDAANARASMFVWLNDNTFVDLLVRSEAGPVDLENPAWQVVELPLELFGTPVPVQSISFTGNLEGTFYLDDFRLVAGPTPAVTAVVEERTDQRPGSFVLNQNYPNPFNPATTIRFDLPDAGEIDLAVYNVSGQRVATLARGQRSAGTYSLRWDGLDDSGRELASGVYLYSLQAEGQTQHRKLLLLR